MSSEPVVMLPHWSGASELQPATLFLIQMQEVRSLKQLIWEFRERKSVAGLAVGGVSALNSLAII